MDRQDNKGQLIIEMLVSLTLILTLVFVALQSLNTAKEKGRWGKYRHEKFH